MGNTLATRWQHVGTHWHTLASHSWQTWALPLTRSFPSLVTPGVFFFFLPASFRCLFCFFLRSFPALVTPGVFPSNLAPAPLRGLYFIFYFILFLLRGSIAFSLALPPLRGLGRKKDPRAGGHLFRDRRHGWYYECMYQKINASKILLWVYALNE